MYFSLELTLIYTETIASFSADQLKDLARAPITLKGSSVIVRTRDSRRLPLIGVQV